MHAADTARPPAHTVVVLGLLTMFGPLSLDLYLPALPQLADDLNASASAAQLSITTCLVGLAVGQLVAGPMSDRLGRKRPLIVGLLAYVLASMACALAPSSTALAVLRLVQGLAGAAGIVISRAIARDLYSGRALMIFFSRLLLVAGLAPVVAPILGGQLSRIMSWRGIFASPLPRVLGLGLAINLLGATALLATVISGLPLAVLIGALVVMVCAVGLIFPTANALAMADYPDLAGTASSLQGLSQFMFGAVAAPLVGIAGDQTALPLGIVTTAVSVCAIASFVSLVIPVVQARAKDY
jgi:Major Facilitator Superfamily